MIIVNLDVMLARRKMRSKELAERIGITEANLSLLKETGGISEVKPLSAYYSNDYLQ